MNQAENSASVEESTAERLVEIRTAPSFPAFIILGTVLGFLVALIVTLTGYESDTYTFGAVLGVMAVIFGIGGAALGAIAALIIDKVGIRRAKVVRAVPTD